MYCVPISNPDSKEEVADWVELFVALNKESISKAAVGSFVEKSRGSEPDETFVDNIWVELERREKLYGDNPPFKVEPRNIIPSINWEKNPEYVMCLLLSIFGNTENATATGKLFERLSAEAIKKYLGSEIIIYGHPSYYSAEEIAEKLNERFNYRPSSNFKDRGLDIIAWKPFGDSRLGQLIVLFQCASGHNWRSKLLMLPLKDWCSYITWGCDPLKGFTLPQIVAQDEFETCSHDGGILIDRARIYRNSLSADFGDSLREELKNWCDNKIRNC